MTTPPEHSCDQQVNAAAWVLGALDDVEIADYATHVDGCPICQADIASLSVVSDALPLATEQIAPPPELSDRIMAVVSSEAQLLRAAGPGADRAVDRPARSARRSWFSGWRLVPVGLAVLAAGLVIGVLLTGSGSSTRVSEAQVTLLGAHARLVVNGNRARLQMTDMPNPPDGKVYEVWIQRRASTVPKPTDALFTVRSNGRGEVVVPTPVRSGDHVLVTAEKPGGSETPTSAPVITAQA